MSSRCATEARRTASCHGRVSRVPTSSATPRTAASTRARWTWVAGGTEVRDALVSARPSLPRSRCSRLSGSGLSRDSHAVTGQPVARRARSRVEAATASTTSGTPAASANASSSSAARSLLALEGLPEPDTAAIAAAASLTSASSLVRVAFLELARLAISSLSASMPMPCRALIAEHRDLVEAVQVEEAAYVGQHRVAPVLRHRVDVVEHHQHHVGVARERLEVAVVDRRVGVLLRVEHPHQQVGELDQPVDLEVVGDLGGVVVGEVEQHGAVEALVLPTGVEHGVPGDLVPGRDAEPLEQLGRAVGPPDAGGRPGRRRAGVRRPRRAPAR